jgi:hypothetical protein
VSTTPPHYSAPDRSRQRIRLIAAIGLLASTAIAIGGAVHLLSTQAEPAGASAPTPTRESTRSTEPSLERLPGDSLSTLLTEIEQAERAVSSARASLRRARILGRVDPAQLDWLERRLDALGGSSAASGSFIDSHVTTQAASPRPSDEGPREL